jgi:hypothetical protein
MQKRNQCCKVRAWGVAGEGGSFGENGIERMNANMEQKGAWHSRREVKSQEKALAKQRKLAEKMKMAAVEGEETPAAEATPAEPAKPAAA